LLQRWVGESSKFAAKGWKETNTKTEVGALAEQSVERKEEEKRDQQQQKGQDRASLNCSQRGQPSLEKRLWDEWSKIEKKLERTKNLSIELTAQNRN